MRSSSVTSWTAALVLSGAAFLSFLTRTFIDYGFVYPQLNLMSSLGRITLFNLAFYGGWIWALMSASHGSRRAMFVLLAYNALLVLFGLTTSISLCPSPCQTAWPVGEIAIWSNHLVGISATVVVALNLFRRASRAP